MPLKTGGIGSWEWIMNLMTVICVVTNIVLFAFSSD